MLNVPVPSERKNVTINLPFELQNIIGSHTITRNKFFVIKGILQKGKIKFKNSDVETEVLFFVPINENGKDEKRKERIDFVFPKWMLKEGDNLAIAISCPGITMVSRGRVLEQKTKDGVSYLWQGPGGTVSLRRLLDRLIPFLKFQENKTILKLLL